VGPGDSPSAAAVALATALAGGDPPELITLIAGDGAEDGETERLAAELGSTFPEAEVQIVRGGQPMPIYLLGVE
jgi:dihydroxyacetone kinase-like predicted kinase